MQTHKHKLKFLCCLLDVENDLFPMVKHDFLMHVYRLSIFSYIKLEIMQVFL